MPTPLSNSNESRTTRLRRVRLRRASVSHNNTHTTPELRPKSRRLFGRSSTSSFSVPTPSYEEHDPGRRSFLAKPPAPGAARRVLTVLNQPGRPRRTNSATNPNTSSYNNNFVAPVAPDPPLSSSSTPMLAARAAVSASGYEEPDQVPSSLSLHDHGIDLVIDEQVDINIDSHNAVHVDIRSHEHDQNVNNIVGVNDHGKDDAIIGVPVKANVGAVGEADVHVDVDGNVNGDVEVVDDDDQLDDTNVVIDEDRLVKHVGADDVQRVNRIDSATSSMPSSRGLGLPTARLIEVEASEISDDIHSSGEPKSRQGAPTSASSFMTGSAGAVTSATATTMTTTTCGTGTRTTTARAVVVDQQVVDDDIDDEDDVVDLEHPRRNHSQLRIESTESDAFFDEDPVFGVAFDAVGADEADIPDAPSLLCDGIPNVHTKSVAGHVWYNLQQQVRALQQAVTIADDEKRTLRQRIDALVQHRKDDEVLMESLRLRAAEATTEVEQLTRQLKDTRRRMTRRVRDLEEQVAHKDTQHSEELLARKQIEKRLRQEIETLKDANSSASANAPASAPTPAPAHPSSSSSRRSRIIDSMTGPTSNVVKSTSSSANGSSGAPTRHTPGSTVPVAALGHADVSARSAVAVGRAHSIATEPGRMRKGRADIPGPPPRSGMNGSISSGNSMNVSNSMGTTSISGIGRPKTPSRTGNSGRKLLNLSVPTSGSGGTGTNGTSNITISVDAPLPPMPPSAVTSKTDMVVGPGLGLGHINDSSTASPKTMARRSLIRRAFIAHIQSPRYRSARMAWFDFFGAEGNHISYDMFARAVRSLAVAADARDRDLEILREELIGSDNSGEYATFLSWAMFAKFYQKTKTLSETW